ncbi:MAG TPA: hypothetical protein VGZ23_11930 [bacterium]|nr:hypothetical protein [bacterium]
MLLGLSIALRLRRGADDVRRAIVLVQELLNIVRRRSGEAAAVPLRAYLEDAYRDLAEATEGDEAVRAAEEGIEACDRTLALARRFHLDDDVPHARAVKALLLRRLGAVRPGADVRSLSREADRLTAAAFSGWPARDAEGLAAFQADVAMALVAGEPPRRAAIDRADDLLRRTARAVPAGNRYLAARVARARARVAIAAGRPDALEAVAEAAAALRDLGLAGEAEEVEHWL